MDHNTAAVLIAGDDTAKDYGESAPIRCYPRQLNQMFLNLRIHARRAIELLGGIHITTRYLDRKEEISPTLAGDSVDGADPALVGGSFFAGKPPGKGPGLCLNAVCGIVKIHGGANHFDSKRTKRFLGYLCR